MALKRPGDRAVLLLAKLLKQLDELQNPMLRAMLKGSKGAGEVIAEIRQIVADAKAESCEGELLGRREP
jgi:hypothetical protein